ncbi:MAG: 5-dehydro-4-deoxy-D-glucuronate isomerase [Acholeplasmataceae bacterium]
MKLDMRYSHHPNDAKYYDTEELREHFVIEEVFVKDEIALTYSHYDRIIAGGAFPVTKELKLDGAKELASEYFLENREMGVISVGGDGEIVLDGKAYRMNFQDGIYIPKGVKEVIFRSKDPKAPAKFYINSAPAHKEYPIVHIPLEKARKVHLGNDDNLNKRTINQYLHPDVLDTCQLAMGLTILAPRNVWNTMPCHTHDRRMEVYFYFSLEPEDLVVHLMGEPQETRHLMIRNEQALISPSWSIHSGVGTRNYMFIWGMCGENKTFSDMDHVDMKDLL